MATSRRLGGVDPFRRSSLPLPQTPSPRARARASFTNQEASQPTPRSPTRRSPPRLQTELRTSAARGFSSPASGRGTVPSPRFLSGLVSTFAWSVGCAGPPPDHLRGVASLLWPSDATLLDLQVWSRSTQCTASSLGGPVARRRSRFSTLMMTAYTYEATTSVFISLVFCSALVYLFLRVDVLGLILTSKNH
jgi:branched-chain amino acid aminotransferase